MNVREQQLLKNVSRSFYLSIRLLPREMREPISLAYLLARASDTLADSGELKADIRSELLSSFSELLLGSGREAWCNKVKKDVVPYQRHAGEKILLASMDTLWEWFDHINDKQKELITCVIKHIIEGQILDIKRFEYGEGYRVIGPEELDDYCYLVAGCVGEFWTEIGRLTVSDFSTVEFDQLKKLGVNYGKGLQLVNILRDQREDQEQGRFYLPVGYDHRHWVKLARQYLDDGKYYASSLKNKRTKMATVLPALLGDETLDLLECVSDNYPVKISRKKVYHCMWQTFFY